MDKYKMYFRFSNEADAFRFWDRLLMGFAFDPHNNVGRNLRKTGISTVTLYSSTRENYILIVVMAALYDSFVNTEIVSAS
jgi:hypothetical protein